MSASPLPLSSILPDNQHEPALQRQPRQIVVTTVVTLIAILNAIGLLIVLRRFVWATAGDLPHGAMLLTAVVATASVAAIRIGWRQLFPLKKTPPFYLDSSDLNWDAIVGWGSSLALFLLAIGCCYPAYSTADWLIWFPPLVADQFWRQTFFDAGHPTAHSLEITPAEYDAEFDAEFDEELAATLAFPIEHDSVDHALEVALLKNISPQTHDDTEQNQNDAEEIVQQLYRVRDDQGQEIIYGTLRADFKAGQRTAVVHVGFCPPLPHIPQIEAESHPGTSARINVVQSLAHGTRLDVRLPAPAEADRHILIDMAATPGES